MLQGALSTDVREMTAAFKVINGPFRLPHGDESWRCAYPINRLRNVAVSRAVTDLIFNLDVDFVPSPGLHDRIVAAVSTATLATNKEKVAFVVPAVEITAGNVIESLDFSNGDLAAHRALRSAMEKGEASPFHVGHYPRGHLPTALNEAWFSASAPYEVDYVEGYEPYVVALREQLPPFDARFRGYGLNKVIHAYAMAAAGFRFMVLPGVPPGPVAATPVDAGCGFVAAAEHPARRLRHERGRIEPRVVVENHHPHMMRRAAQRSAVDKVEHGHRDDAQQRGSLHRHPRVARASWTAPSGRLLPI